MDIFKENLNNFSKFSQNVIKDRYKCERGERGGGQKQPSPTFSCNAKNQYL